MFSHFSLSLQMNGFSCGLISLRIKQRLKYLISQKVLDEHMQYEHSHLCCFSCIKHEMCLFSKWCLNFSYPEKLEA